MKIQPVETEKNHDYMDNKKCIIYYHDFNAVYTAYVSILTYFFLYLLFCRLVSVKSIHCYGLVKVAFVFYAPVCYTSIIQNVK